MSKTFIADPPATPVPAEKVMDRYASLLCELGSELFVPREAPLQEIERAAGICTAEGIRRLRSGQLEIEPGCDGVYGKIKLMDKSEIEALSG